MKLVKTVKELRSYIEAPKRQGKTVGLVPTMGFLHEGHESLIRRGREENDLLIVSIFVNPTQFGQGEDFEDYPRDLEADLKKCQDLGVDYVFSPEVDEMYSDHRSYVEVEELTLNLCGKSRPSHFRGVTTVVLKLLNISQADRAYFGEKDAQQLFVIKKMVKDLNMPVEIVGCQIIREADGLAMSSRNKYLSDSERQLALEINRALSYAKTTLVPGIEASIVKGEIEDVLKNHKGIRIDYIEIVDTENLQPVLNIDRDLVVAVAVYIGKTRLIDNFIYRI